MHFSRSMIFNYVGWCPKMLWGVVYEHLAEIAGKGRRTAAEWMRGAVLGPVFSLDGSSAAGIDLSIENSE